MTEVEIIKRLLTIQSGLAKDYNILPWDDFTRKKVATAIDQLMELIYDIEKPE